MGTELMRSEGLVKEMSAIESAWNNLPSVEKPQLYSTIDQIEEGYISGGYVSLVLSSLALLPSTSIAFMTGFDSVGSIVATVATAIFLPVGGIVAELVLEDKKSFLGMLDTRILRRKKYRRLSAKEQLEYAESMNVYNQKHKKAEKVKKKLIVKAERISSETDGKMLFSDGKFSSIKKEKPLALSAREQDLMGQLTNQLEIRS